MSQPPLDAVDTALHSKQNPPESQRRGREVKAAAKKSEWVVVLKAREMTLRIPT
jgi:hypothetical protein